MSIQKFSFFRPLSSLRNLFSSGDTASTKQADTGNAAPSTGDAFESKSAAPDSSATKKLLGDPVSPNLNDALEDSLDLVEGKRKRGLGGFADAGDAIEPEAELGEQEPLLLVEGKRKRRLRRYAELDDQLGLDPGKKTYYA